MYCFDSHGQQTKVILRFVQTPQIVNFINGCCHNCAVVQVNKPSATSDQAETADAANGEENTASTKLSKKKPKKEDKWKQKMMFLYEDGANAEEDVSEAAVTETEAVADSRLLIQYAW